MASPIPSRYFPDGALVLDEIIASTRRRLDDLRARESELRALPAVGPRRDFESALGRGGRHVIAEFKRRSPSRGELAAGLKPAPTARQYAAGGASALSVLTEPDHFLGSPADLVAAREATNLPVLRKDFILEAVQIWEARAMGADAVLLIVALLGDAVLAELILEAKREGLAALVEVHDEEEVRRALEAGAGLVGVNNRDLTTFQVDLGTAERLAPRLEGVVRVAESSIASAADAARMWAVGFDAILVGESLLRSGDPGRLIAELKAAS